MNTALVRVVAPALLLATFSSFAATLHVDVNSTNPVPPYTNWATAANVIQDAVDAASAGDTVLVTSGVYAMGGKAVYGTMTNRVAVDKPLTLLSVNGQEGTVIQGYQLPGTTNGDGAIRCVYLTNDTLLSGFTLAEGATRAAGDSIHEQKGGGLWCESASGVVTNCLIVNNTAHSGGGGALGGTLVACTIISNSVPKSSWWGDGGGVDGSTVSGSSLRGNFAWYGGGAFRSTLEECLIVANWAWDAGGGADHSTLRRCILVENLSNGGGGAWGGVLTLCLIARNSANFGGGTVGGTLTNCTIAGNSAEEIGGAYCGALNNCIIYHNSANTDPDYLFDGELYGLMMFSCTTPLPVEGSGNITNAPLFVNTNGWADLRLQSNSPCINAGNNAYVTTTNDLDRNPRIVGGTVDMGAYEFQSPQSVISYAYLQRYGLPSDGSVDNLDTDNDKATTWQEWKAWTDPTNALSVLKLLTPQPGSNGTVVPWQSVAGHSYRLERATNGTAALTLLQSGIAGQAGTTSFTDITATNGESFLYRVGVPE